jgi:hypothetical protein
MNYCSEIKPHHPFDKALIKSGGGTVMLNATDSLSPALDTEGALRLNGRRLLRGLSLPRSQAWLALDEEHLLWHLLTSFAKTFSDT